MERIVYWLKNVLKKNMRNCVCFCPVCRYFEICREDYKEDSG